MSKLLKFVIALLLALSVTLPVNAEKTVLEDSRGQKEAIISALRSYFGLDELPIAYQIVRCESRFRQFDELGNILRGIVVPEDRGAFQINETYHLEDSKKLGYNIYSIEGNVAMAKHLYDTFGWQPWSASRSCWGI